MVNITFWGVRGSTPCPCDANVRYGGNTSCVSLEAPGLDPIVFDLGTGLRFYGDVIDPTDTRKMLIDALNMLESKKEELPPRKHGNMPL